MGAPELVKRAEEVGALEASWDVLFTTSLVSFAELIALLPPRLSALPRVLYMHENQAAYPAAPGRKDPRDGHAVATNITSMLAADIILWNSRWNRDSFLAGLRAMLGVNVRHTLADLPDRILDRSIVCWPPVEDVSVDHPSESEVLHNATEAHRRGLTLVAWPHRWEHDKGPEELLALDRAHGASAGLGWVLLGEQFQHEPESLRALREGAGDRVIHAGRAARCEYLEWLAVSDWVCSTAVHEFFGIAVAEALLAGCLPWLPDRLSYPELLPAAAKGLSPMSPPADAAEVRHAVSTHLEACTAARAVRAIEDAATTATPLTRR